MRKTATIGIVALLVCLLLVGCSSASGGSSEPVGGEALHYNQVGYYVTAPKEFSVINSAATSFDIIDSGDAVVQSGTLTDAVYWSDAGENVKTGDFTSLQTAGTYRIKVGTMLSSEFSIGDSVLTPVGAALEKFYYYQRASFALTADCADAPYARASGHPDTAASYHSTSGKTGGTRDVHGGWYDAGDYGKYIVNGGISVATLMGLYEAAGDVTGDDALNIPESSNGKSDLLDEIKYETDWFKTMQDTDGGVFFKVAATTWANAWCMPASDPNTRYVIGKSTTSTLNFAAVMAQASRVFASYDSAYAADCSARAINAWTWAKSHAAFAGPTTGGANDGSGAYGDSTYTDEFNWAACELYLATGTAEYKTYLDGHLGGYSIGSAADWANVRNLGIYSLAIKGTGAYKTGAVAGITGFADALLGRMASHPSDIPMQTADFNWGSNGGLANYGVILAYAYTVSNDAKYLRGASKVADYLLGKNATGYCFVSGFGSTRVMHPHHRVSANDNVVDPVPGMLSGGPNVDQNDLSSGLVTYPSNLPALCYTDDSDSYASNEVTINWNAPAAFVFYVLEKNKASF